jgi:hypothetical protein
MTPGDVDHEIRQEKPFRFTQRTYRVCEKYLLISNSHQLGEQPPIRFRFLVVGAEASLL